MVIPAYFFALVVSRSHRLIARLGYDEKTDRPKGSARNGVITFMDQQ